MAFRIYPHLYIREDVARMDGVFVFGDNMEHKGTAGQAIIRGLPNAFGFPTKWRPKMSYDAFFTDNDPEVARIITDYLGRVETLLVFGNEVWWPISGIGTGLARMQETAPIQLGRIQRKVAKWSDIYC